MSELEAIATVLRCIGQVVEGRGPLAQKFTDIRRQELLRPEDGFREPESRAYVFSGLPETGGAGAAASLACRRADQRMILWTIQVWIEKWDKVSWSADVKGEIEVDDEFGDPQTVFEVRRTVREVPAIAAAVHECAELVGGYVLTGK
jgi:hypothetical protein